MMNETTANKTIVVLHPGEMGAAIGAGLIARGHRVVWACAGRSDGCAFTQEPGPGFHE
jgi:hypothetical protein